jgi:hypothetical protein
VALTKTDPVPVNLPPATPCEQARAEIAKYSDWNVNTVQAIAQAENRACNPLKHNETASETHRRADGSVICVGSYGVLQVGCLHFHKGEDRDNLTTQIEVAHRVWQNRKDYTAWTMFNNGTYREFLK